MCGHESVICQISYQPLIQGHLLLDSPMTGGVESITENRILDYYKYWSQNFSEAESEVFNMIPDEGKGEVLLNPTAQLHPV